MKLYADDDPLVLAGIYDTEGYQPGERARLLKARQRQEHTMAKTTKAKPVNGRRRERQVPLTGMEGVRIRALDDCAASIAEIREDLAKNRADEDTQLNRALTLMRKHERFSWRAHGVELVRVPGEEKLRVRTSKEKATAETEEEEDNALEEAIVADTEPPELRQPGDEIRPGVKAEH